MPVPIEEMLVMYICVSAWFLLDFGPVPLVWYALYFVFFHHNDWLINCCLMSSEYYSVAIAYFI
jgi:hypothetical protein